MPRLVVLNGPPGIGKSTLARRYAETSGCVVVEQDAWFEELGHAAARERSVEVVRAHLGAGRDVLVPQFVADPTYLDRLSSLAASSHAAYVELVLLADPDVAEARFRARADGPAAAAELEDHPAACERLLRALDGREVRVLDAAGTVDATFGHLLNALDGCSPDEEREHA